MKLKTLFTLAGLAVGLIAALFFSGVGCPASCEVAAANETIAIGPSAELLRPDSLIPGDVVTEWNQYAAALSLTTAPTPAPVQQTRLMAIVHVSVHDAVNGITREYETYLPAVASPKDASAEAAAIAAAYRAMSGLFGNGPFPALGNKTLSQLYSESLAAHGLSVNDPGIGYGTSAADAILGARSTDGAAQAQFPYDGPNTDPGTWRLLPGQTALLAGWGNVAPFVLRSGSQFRPEAPLALNSEEYARDYNEIKEIGSAASTTRTGLQSQIATFWRASPTAIWNPVIRQSLAARSFDLSETARAYALFYLAASDASVACWDAKYVYNLWRPQSAIRRGSEDGNDATEADPTWTPFIATPPHPEYASGHATNSSSMAAVLESLFGKDPEMTISVTLSGITRQWTTFDEAVQEVIDARVYSGIHFRNSDVVGARQGRQVAQFVMAHALRPCQGKGSRCE
jgi:hypothetical protein